MQHQPPTPEPTGAGAKSAPARPTTVKLTRRDLAIVQDVARFKFLTSRHVQARHFTGTNDNNAANRLSKLFSAGFLSRVYFHPKISGKEKAHPTGVFFFSKTNQNRFKKALEETGQASFFEDFSRNLPSYNKSEEYSQLYLLHELGITDFFFRLEQETADSQEWKIAFWERTSPFSKEIGEHLSGYAPDPQTQTKTQKLHFNPDAFFGLKHQPTGAHFFYFLELDNNTATAAKFRQKLYGYMAYQEQRRFSDLLERYNGKYLLGLREPKRAGFRVVTITPHRKRRDDLFLDSLTVRDEHEKARFKMFLYASLADVLDKGGLSPVCLRGKDYAPIAEQQKALPSDISPASLRRWQDEQLATMHTVSLLEE
jgi:hypothetical protein